MDTDIDIDVADRDKALQSLMYIPASMVFMDKKVNHNTGIYFQNVPTDPVYGFCSFTYKEAEDLGYFKIDILPNGIYEGVQSEEHLTTLLNTEPPWELFEDPDIVSLLAHIRDHFDVVNTIKPKSIEDLAICIAILRPGKRHLLEKPRSTIDAEIWKRTEEGYFFKRSHAIAYAASIVVQLNLLVEQS